MPAIPISSLSAAQRYAYNQRANTPGWLNPTPPVPPTPPALVATPPRELPQANGACFPIVYAFYRKLGRSGDDAPYYEDVCVAIGYSRKALSTAFATLEDGGYIRRQQRQMPNRPSEYEIGIVEDAVSVRTKGWRL